MRSETGKDSNFQVKEETFGFDEPTLAMLLVGFNAGQIQSKSLTHKSVFELFQLHQHHMKVLSLRHGKIKEVLTCYER